jgi:hypothetical protein
MSNFRYFVLSLCGVCLCVGLVNGEDGLGEEAAEPPPENPVVLGGVEICGPVYEAFVFLGPKGEDGKLDPGQIRPWPHPSGLFMAEFAPPAHVAVEFAGFAPTRFFLEDFKGLTQIVTASWYVDVDDRKAVWSGMYEKLKDAHGEPDFEDDEHVSWKLGRLRKTITTIAETGEMDLSHACMPTENEFWARKASVPVPEQSPEAAKASNEFQPSERSTGNSLLDVLATRGEPSVEPIWQSDRIVGLYYEDFEIMGIPCRQWVWFVDGESVYTGYEFAPPLGPSRALEAFEMLTEGLTGWYGEPYAHIGGEDFDRIQNRWLRGPEETALSLEMADDPPWMSLENIDTEKIREIGGDLRPGGKPIPRYMPPPKDSGKTRPDNIRGTASG